MSQTNIAQLRIATEKYEKAFQLLQASVKKITTFDIDKNYTADELEP